MCSTEQDIHFHTSFQFNEIKISQLFNLSRDYQICTRPSFTASCEQKSANSNMFKSYNPSKAILTVANLGSIPNFTPVTSYDIFMSFKVHISTLVQTAAYKKCFLSWTKLRWTVLKEASDIKNYMTWRN